MHSGLCGTTPWTPPPLYRHNTARHGAGRLRPPPPPAVPLDPTENRTLKLNEMKCCSHWAPRVQCNFSLLFTLCLGPEVVPKVVAACMLLFPGALWMVVVASWFSVGELRLAAAGWLGGFGNPPNPPPPLAGWLASAPPELKTTKIRSAPLYRLFSRMVWVWGWVCKGGGGRPPFKNTLTSYSKLPCLRNLP